MTDSGSTPSAPAAPPGHAAASRAASAAGSSPDGPPRIQVLAPELASQIAAGEVVERPASAAKELIENALDAGAQRVTVGITGGGVTLLTVVDDGRGMDALDAELSVERHATSKLRSLADLTAVPTFGFRGEALPSIASVSRFALRTRPASEAAGVEVRVEGGQRQPTRPAGAPVGTTVEVRDLFFNVPARRKFLKAANTESGHVLEVLENAALVRPDVTFGFDREGRRVREWLSTPALADRVTDVLGEEELVAVQGERGPLSVQAFLSRPERARPGAGGLRLFVNGRPVRDRALALTVAQSYGSVLERGRYPRGVVYLEVPAPHVDVNVHPQKSEVRFADQRAVNDAVYAVLSRELARAFSLPAPARHAWARAREVARPGTAESTAVRGAAYGGAGSPAVGGAADASRAGGSRDAGAAGLAGAAVPASEEGEDTGSPGVGGPGRAPAAAVTGAPGERRAAAEPAQRSFEVTRERAMAVGGTGSPARAGGGASAPPQPQAEASAASAAALAEGEASERLLATADARAPLRPSPTTTFGALRFLVQVRQTYLLCEGPDALYLLDQHAAAERVAFHRLRRLHGQRDIPSQALMFPTVLDVTPAEVELVEQRADAIAAVGIELRVRGPDSISVHAVPRLLARASPERLVRDLLAEATRTGGRGFSDAIDLALATWACHGSIRAGDPVTADEARALLQALDGADFAGHCPHGRPVVTAISFAELERKVGRR